MTLLADILDLENQLARFLAAASCEEGRNSDDLEFEAIHANSLRSRIEYLKKLMTVNEREAYACRQPLMRALVSAWAGGGDDDAR